MTPTRPLIIVSGIVALCVMALVAYFWFVGQEPAINPAQSSDESLSATTGGSVQSTNSGSQRAEATAQAAGGDESIETLMAEIEKNAGGEDTAMEEEVNGENESFMEGAVVMEQLGQSYDENNY